MQTDCEQLDRMKWTALHHNGNRHCWPGFKGQKILLYIIAVIFPHCLQSKQLEHRTERNGIFYALSGHYGGVSVTNVSEDRIAAGKGYVVIPSAVRYNHTNYAVTDIEQEAFAGKSGLRAVKLPDCVIAIHDAAFAGCDNLEKVELNEGLKDIYAASFAGCTKLRQITIPYSVEYIGARAFQGCSNLSSVVFYGEKRMGKDVFCECPSLSQSGIKIMPQEPAPQPAIVVGNENKVQRAVKTKPIAEKHTNRQSPRSVLKVTERGMLFWKILILVEIILAFLAFGLRRDETKNMRYPIKIFHNVSREMFISLNFFPVFWLPMWLFASVMHADHFMEMQKELFAGLCAGMVMLGGFGSLMLSVPMVMQKLLHIPFLTITDKYIRKGTFWSALRGKGYIYYDDVVDLRLVRKAFGRDSNIPLSAQLDAGCYSFRLKHWCLRIIRKGKRAEWICLTGLELEPHEIYDMLNSCLANVKEKK